jgi:hypothetical protein
MENAAIDTLNFNAQGVTGTGSVAQRLVQNGMNIHALRPWIGSDGRAYMAVNQGGKLVPQLTSNATLRFVEWKQYDEAVIREARIRLLGVQDLVSRGLVYNITNGMGKTVLETENLGEFTVAEISMDGLSRTQSDRANFGTAYLPLPIVHKDYFINTRVLAVSRNIGDALDTTSAELATRQVAEKMEDMLFNGTGSYAYGGGTIYGYTDFPNRNTMDLTAHWDASGVTPDDIIQDVLAMKQALIGDRMYGPYVLYVPTGYETILDKDYVPQGGTNSTKTLRQRILDIQNIADVKIIDKLTAHNVLLVQMTSDVVRIVNGMEIAPVEWQEQGGMVLHYKVMGIKVPQIRSTQAGRCGICHLRPAE